jgi:hypothetical protein
MPVTKVPAMQKAAVIWRFLEQPAGQAITGTVSAPAALARMDFGACQVAAQADTSCRYR